MNAARSSTVFVQGKSAALGIAIAAAVGFGYANIFVTSPSPENLNTLFEFVFKGLDALAYSEHMDYEAVQSTNPEFNNAIVRINIFRAHRQTIQYVHPHDADKVNQAELVVIDEAAAIPLPVVKKLLGPYLVFMASTINGYEGTGRSLSLKLLDQLRKSQDSSAVATAGMGWWKDRTKKANKKPADAAPKIPSDPWAQAMAETTGIKKKQPKAEEPAPSAGAGAGAGAGSGAAAARNTSIGGRGRVLREVCLLRGLHVTPPLVASRTRLRCFAGVVERADSLLQERPSGGVAARVAVLGRDQHSIHPEELPQPERLRLVLRRS